MDLNQVHERGLEVVTATRGCLSGFVLRFNKINTRFPGAGHANIVRQNAGLVEGVLLELPDAVAIERMDPFEGVPDRYRRTRVMVECSERTREAWTYIGQPAWLGEGLRPTRDYLQRLLNGQAFLSPSYWQWLASHPVIDEGVAGLA